MQAPRVLALTDLILFVYVEAHKEPPEPGTLMFETELKVWQIALEDIPTASIPECLERAVRKKRDTFPLRSSQILAEWDILKVELAEAEKHRVLNQPLSARPVCRTCKGAGKVVDRSIVVNDGYYMRRLMKCPDCDGKYNEPPRSSGPLMSFTQWRAKHLSECDGCDNTRFALAHARPARTGTLLEQMAARFASTPPVAPSPSPDTDEWEVTEEDEQSRAMWQNYTRTEATTATITVEDDDEDDIPF
jgi:hypothetical protein